MSSGNENGFRVLRGYTSFLWVLVTFDLAARSMSPGLEAGASAIHATLLMVGSLLTLARLWRAELASVLSPLAYVLLPTATFYGLGVLFYNFGNEASREWVDRHYSVTGSELLMVNLVVSAGLAVTWSAATWVISLPPKARSNAQQGARLSPAWLARYFFVVGFGVQYGLVVPYMLGWTSFVLPGFVMLMVNVSYASIFLMAVSFHRGKGREFRLLLPAGVAAGVLAGLLVTSKTWVVLSLAFYFLGAYYASRRSRSLIAGLLLVAVAYMAVTPFTHFVRNSVAGQSGLSVTQSVDIWVDYVENPEPNEPDGIQWAFLRLSYVGGQAYAIAQFEQGSAGDTILGGMQDVLLPRLLFPDKPVRSLGNAFSEEYGGNSDNSKSPGVLAEAFWNGGWLGLVTICIIVGVLLGVAHRFVVRSIIAEDWVVLPLCVGLFLGLGQIHGFFSNVFVYGPIVLVGLQLGLYAVASLIGRLQTAKSS